MIKERGVLVAQGWCDPRMMNDITEHENARLVYENADEALKKFLNAPCGRPDSKPLRHSTHKDKFAELDTQKQEARCDKAKAQLSGLTDEEIELLKGLGFDDESIMSLLSRVRRLSKMVSDPSGLSHKSKERVFDPLWSIFFR